MTRLSKQLLTPVLLVAGLLLAGCEQPRAHGDQNAVIVAVDEDLWFQIEDDFRERMEPPVQTVRRERPFRLTQADPRLEEAWGQIQRFRRMVVVGSETTPWVASALDRYGDTVPPAPAMLEVRDVWARGQRVWIMLLPEDDPAPHVEELAGQVFERMDEEFREFVRNRMYISGRDTLLADSLGTHVGFSMLFPNVYRYSVQDSVFRFRNDNPSPAELIREIAVTWWEPAPEEDPDQENLVRWRDELAHTYYVNPQALDTTVVTFGPVEVDGARGVEFQSAWQSLPDAWPAGGPFITRALRCPDQDRMYVMDAWVYAPDREKYEYVIQLQNILNSFRCH
jgi:hypothetical protein